MTDQTAWRNRIVGEGVKPASQFMANDKNWRVHPQAQRDALHGALNEVGWVAPVIENARTGCLVDGHERVWQALQNGDAPVPYVEVDLSEAEEAYVLATLDPIGAMAQADPQKLDELLHEVQSGEAGVQQLLAELAENAKLYGQEQASASGDAPEPQIDRAEELNKVWQVQPGDLWEIPSKTVKGKCHRLLCGDSTRKEDVERLMGAEKADMVWTDPPYGINYGEKMAAANPMGYRVRNIQNDDLPPAELEKFIRASLTLAAQVSARGSAIYVASPAGTTLPTLIRAFDGSGFEFRWHLVWLKDQMVLSRGDYHSKHENILYGWKPDGAHYFTDDRTQVSVFEVPRPKASAEHPTMKPPELIAMMVRNSSRRGAVVYDPFMGSGSTIIACEQTGRIGRGIDIEQKYAAVVLQRLADLGLEPRRVA